MMSILRQVIILPPIHRLSTTESLLATKAAAAAALDLCSRPPRRRCCCSHHHGSNFPTKSTTTVSTKKVFYHSVATARPLVEEGDDGPTTVPFFPTTHSKDYRAWKKNHHGQRIASTPPAIVVPTTTRQYESDLVVVLDMDECLVHTQFVNNTSAAAQAQAQAHQLLLPNGGSGSEGGSSTTSTSATNTATPTKKVPAAVAVDSFHMHLPQGEVVQVNVRPGLHDFLHKLCHKYETHIFTAGIAAYADPLLDTLDPHRTLFAGRWYRDSCQYDAQHHAYVKNLNNLSLYQELDRVVMVDNNPLSFLSHPSNGILVRSFYNDGSDDGLHRVWQLVETLDKEHDVRPKLKQMFGLEDAFQTLRSNVDF